MLYRVPRVSPGVTASILRSPPSRATSGPIFFTDHCRVPRRSRYSVTSSACRSILLRVDLNPLPVLFSEKDFKSNFRLSENFVPAGHFFPDNSSNRAAEVGCGGEVVGGGPFGEDGCQERCRAAETTRTRRV